MMNGFPTEDSRLKDVLANTSNSLLQDLAGNAFPSTVVAALVIAIQFGLNEGTHVADRMLEDAESKDVEDALHLLKKARHES